MTEITPTAAQEPEHHPLTKEVFAVASEVLDDVDLAAIDNVVREFFARTSYVVDTGVRFSEAPDTEVEVAATFIESGNQMQMAIIGVEPVILVQPEFDAEANKVTLVTTTVDLPPAGLVEVLETLLDATRQVVEQQESDES